MFYVYIYDVYYNGLIQLVPKMTIHLGHILRYRSFHSICPILIDVHVVEINSFFSFTNHKYERTFISNLHYISNWDSNASFTQEYSTILCLIPRTTVTSLSAPKNTHCKTHPVCVNPGVLFLNVWESTQVTRAMTRHHCRYRGETKYRWP